jgi:hypothetical protein
MSKLRTLIWAYLLLLLFEGALRKWIVPVLDAPLLIIRDPVVLWIYYEAYRSRLSFTNNAFFFPNLILGVVTTILALVAGDGTLLITYFGIHCNYMHIPLIFLMAQILNRDDVIAIGRFLLYVSVPMAFLVIFQFRSSPDSLVNIGAIHTWYGTVRPSGTFSYIAGLVSYFDLVAAFLFYGYLQSRTYRLWLIIAVTCSVMITTACSGSRSFLISVGIDAVFAVFIVVMRGKGGLGILVGAALIGLSLPVLSTLPVFKVGAAQLTQRFTDAAASGENTSGMFDRYAGTLLNPVATSGETPLFGHGIGSGTNAASGLIRGERGFIGPEDEWGRLFFECGPIFGMLLVIFRTALTLAVGKCAYDAMRRDNILPMLIYAGTCISLLNGQWGVPTSLGFAVFGGGLTLAACVEPEEEEDYDEEQEEEHADDELDHSSPVGLT